ncbi:MAG: hypothetical protein HFH35_13850 [Eubacterium sp.]|nr:hypothetical protein [Eubacterium sp.]
MLFWKELKKVVIGIPYLLFVAVLFLALHSQGALDFGGEKITEPDGSGNYGMRTAEIPKIIMPAALQSLDAEFQENNYRTYPIGFLKNVKLDQEEQRHMAQILAAATGMDAEKIWERQSSPDADRGLSFQAGEESGNVQVQPDGSGGFTISKGLDVKQAKQADLTVKSGLPYEKFQQLMDEADHLLGGGSAYAPESLIGFGKVPVTYDEAVKRYALAKNKDRFTGGYARLFSDYATVMALSILPVFLAVILTSKDRKANMSELVYTRAIPGWNVVLMRFLALLTACMLPVVILSYISNASVWGMYQGMKLDYLAPLKYDVGWILPSVMIVTAIGMFLTELTDTPVAAVVCGFWWFIDTNLGMKTVSASASLFRLSPRHNAGAASYFRTQDFIDHFARLSANRLLMAGLSLLFVIAAIVLYEEKRKGYFYGMEAVKRAFAGMGNRKKQSQA